ncbi:hypothetical protein QBC39DRAFT_364434 [Podospora conica]|nr:hypothetical protein QBC39DRAFT_364434 [Schizothecium conicum]
MIGALWAIVVVLGWSILSIPFRWWRSPQTAKNFVVVSGFPNADDVGRLAHVCIVHDAFLRTGYQAEPQTLYSELGLSPEDGFDVQKALATIKKHIEPPNSGELGYEDLEILMTQAVQAGENKPQDPRREALFQAYTILADKHRRKLYDEFLLPIFKGMNPRDGLEKFCEWDTDSKTS